MTLIRNAHSGPRRVALVTQGYDSGGGVATEAKWLRCGLESTGAYSVDVFDLATSWRDATSRRLAVPNTWLRRSLKGRSDLDEGVQHWGANAVEVELMRYRPRTELSRTLLGYDLIQVIAGSAALGASVVRVNVPVVLAAATNAAWERHSQSVDQPGAARFWRRGMTALTTRVERSALTRADVVLVLNDLMLEHVRALGSRHVVKAPPGIDTGRFVPRRGGWRNDGYLLSVGRLGDHRKGMERTVLAYDEMLRTHSRMPDLVLAGWGDLTRVTADLIHSLGLGSRVQVRSGIGEKEMINLYQGASVFLLTSHEEGLGISVLEAMACGLPVVCTNTAGTRETVDSERTGWLVAQGPNQVVARAVAERVRAALDGRGASMGANGRDRCVNTFSLDVALGRFTEVYDSLIPNPCH